MTKYTMIQIVAINGAMTGCTQTHTCLNGGHRNRSLVRGRRRGRRRGEARARGDGARMRVRVEMYVKRGHHSVRALLKEAMRAERERVHEKEALPQQLERVREHATIERAVHAGVPSFSTCD